MPESMTPTVTPLDLAEQPELAAIGRQALSSARYDQFLTGEGKGASKGASR